MKKIAKQLKYYINGTGTALLVACINYGAVDCCIWAFTAEKAWQAICIFILGIALFAISGFFSVELGRNFYDACKYREKDRESNKLVWKHDKSQPPIGRCTLVPREGGLGVIIEINEEDRI